MMTYVFAGAGLLLGIQCLLLWRFLRVTREMRRYDDRVAHFADTLALLTETAESGFQAVAAEVSRLSAAGSAVGSERTTTRRVASAARRGRTVPQIAADEQVSEGEVRLRLQLFEQAARETARARAATRTVAAQPAPGVDHGPLRA
jgi:hypothetical protein